MKKNIVMTALVLGIILLFIGTGIVSNIGANLSELGNIKYLKAKAIISSRLNTVTSKDTIYVDDDAQPGWYDATHVRTIQEGINNASDNDTVYVFNGTYNEHVVIIKKVDLMGEDSNTTVIDGYQDDPVIYIECDGVNISGFTICNSGSYPNTGIYVYYSDHIMISDNIITNNGFYGVWFTRSSISNISNNTITGNNGTGFYLYHHSNQNHISGNIISENLNGIYFDHLSTYNTVTSNMIINNRYRGFYLDYSQYNVIDGNTITDNWQGFFFWSARLNAVVRNIIVNNSGEGMFFRASSAQNIICANTFADNGGPGIATGDYWANYNIIYHNNFINQTQHAYDVCTNGWDNGYFSGGNYWDDFDEPGEGAWDNNSDGFVDEPRDIPGRDNQDECPLMHPWNQSIIIYACGDFNNDGLIDIGDVVNLLNFLFRTSLPPRPLVCAGDANGDQTVDVGDVVYLVNYLFRGGPAPSGCCD